MSRTLHHRQSKERRAERNAKRMAKRVLLKQREKVVAADFLDASFSAANQQSLKDIGG